MWDVAEAGVCLNDPTCSTEVTQQQSPSLLKLKQCYKLKPKPNYLEMIFLSSFTLMICIFFQ